MSGYNGVIQHRSFYSTHFLFRKVQLKTILSFAWLEVQPGVILFIPQSPIKSLTSKDGQRNHFINIST